MTIQSDTTKTLTSQLKELIEKNTRANKTSAVFKLTKAEYKPKQNTIEKLSKFNVYLHDTFYYFSFTNYFSYKAFKTDIWLKICKTIFPFSDKQISCMSPETIELVKVQGLKGIMASFHTLRRSFFTDTEMIESDYEKKRLQFFVQNQSEPIRVYTTEEYEYILYHMEDMMKKAVDIYFARDKRYYLSDTYKTFLLTFYYKMLEKFDTLNHSVLKILQENLFERIKNERLTEEDIRTYFTYKKPLLTQEISFAWDLEEFVSKKTESIEAMINLFDLCIDKPLTISRMLTQESTNEVLGYMIYFAKLDEQTITKVVHEMSVQDTLNKVNNFLNNISPFIQLIENKYSNRIHEIKK